MFGRIIYYDKKAVQEYMSIIKGQKYVQIREMEVSNDKGVGFDLKYFSADAKGTKKYSASIIESLLYDCAEFENLLSGRDDFFDFTQSTEYDMNTIQRGTIIKFDSYIDIPEEFDLMQLIDRFKPILIDSFDMGDMDSAGKDALMAVFNNAKATRIPLIIDSEECLLSSKIDKDNIIGDYDEFEEFEDEQVTILARMASGLINSNKPYYDPLRDFMSLNRMMRKSIKDRGNELKPLMHDREYRQIDILAIYR